MRFIATVAFLLVISSPALASQSGYSGKFLSMEEAEKICIENNLLIRAKKAEIKKADAEIISAKMIPNPLLRYAASSLKNGERETEESYSVSQSIDISGKRSKRIDAAKKSREAHLYFLKYEISGIILHLRQTYYKILYLKEKERLLTDLISVFENVKSKTEERVKAGDVSESELMKISSEKKNIKRSLKTLKIDLRAEKRTLGMLLNLEVNDLQLKGENVYKPLMPDLKIAPEFAILQRYDIIGQGMLVEAAAASLSFARAESLPSFDIEAGYRRRTGGFEGFVFGVTIPLPIFDRNQGGIERAKRLLEHEKITFEFMKKNAIYEVATFQEKIDSLKEIISGISQQLDTARQLTKIARIAYEEGEISLLQLLDAVRSEKALSMEYIATSYEYWATIFELKKAAGKKISNFD